MIPEHLKCPLTKQIMQTPVIIFDGMTYEKSEIWKYLQTHGKSPQTGKKMPFAYEMDDMRINSEIFNEIQEFHNQ